MSASRMSWSRTLLLAGTAAIAVLLIAAPGGCGKSGPNCASGQTNCGGVCADLQTNPIFCGSCTKVCPRGATCQAGQCQCPAGQVSCGTNPGTCVDTSTDEKNCGACGHDCGKGTCVAGACDCAGFTDCGGSPQCVDTTSDPKNCNGCGKLCPLLNEACSSSTCSCQPPFATTCPSACVNTQTDTSNCNGCGIVCLANEVCQGGCECLAPFTPCPNAPPTVCTNLATDGENCGACENACTGGQVCSASTCKCPTGQTFCNGCVNTNTDSNNCGGCGTVCGAGKSCTSGLCCATGTIACGGSCCNGGTACCSGSTCPLQHFNGLGGTFFDCFDLQSAGAAADAAKAWAPNGSSPSSSSLFLNQDCVAWQNGNVASPCAVWCFDGSTAAGLVHLDTSGVGCVAPFIGDPASLTWQ
jgi:hypothetical protein